MREQKQLNIALGCIINDGKVLLTKRRESAQPDIDGLWELPGGKVEFGESPLETVTREVKEETGCEVKNPTGLPFPFIAIRSYEAQIVHAIIFCFECELSTAPSTLRHAAEGKIAEVRWFPLGELDLMQVMAGSREFLCWVAQRHHGVDLKSTSGGPFFSYISFECFQPEQNHRKFYFISVSFDPDTASTAPYQLTTAWGRLSSRERLLSKVNAFQLTGVSKVRVESFRDANDMHARLTEIATTRIEHGYGIIDYKANFPLRLWLQQNQGHVRQPASWTSQLELRF